MTITKKNNLYDSIKFNIGIMSTVVIKNCLHISFHDIKINDYNDYHKKNIVI